MAKKTRVNLYNKGKRRWPLKDNGVNVELNPGKSLELDKDQAEKMIANYPNDFLLGNKPDAAVNPKIKALNATIETLTADKKDLQEQVETLTAKIEELETPISDIAPSEES